MVEIEDAELMGKFFLPCIYSIEHRIIFLFASPPPVLLVFLFTTRQTIIFNNQQFKAESNFTNHICILEITNKTWNETDLLNELQEQTVHNGGPKMPGKRNERDERR